MPELEIMVSTLDRNALERVAALWGMCPDADLQAVASELLQRGLDRRMQQVRGAPIKPRLYVVANRRTL